MSSPCPVSTSQMVPFRTFEVQLQNYYNRNGYEPVEMALIALSKDSSWNQRILKKDSVMLTFFTQVELEKRVVLQLNALPEEARNGIPREANSTQGMELDTVVSVVFLACIAIIGFAAAYR